MLAAMSPVPVPGSLQVWRREPLVVGVVVLGGEDAEAAAHALEAQHADRSFVTVVAAHDDAHLDAILSSPVRRRVTAIIFTAPSRESDLDGATAAFRALDRHGLGQDHAFTVPTLDEAVPYALRALG